MARQLAGFEVECEIWEQGFVTVAGVDEVGRGTWAGPLLIAAAAVTKEDLPFAPQGLADSKAIRPASRDLLAQEVLAWVPVGLGWVSSKEIDAVGLAKALRLAAARALDDLAAQGVRVDFVIQDGSARFVPESFPARVEPKSDARCGSVAAASIVAKVARDNWMKEHGARFEQHPALVASSGYGTKDHIRSLKEYGPCELHRLSFNIPGKDCASAEKQ